MASLNYIAGWPWKVMSDQPWSDGDSCLTVWPWSRHTRSVWTRQSCTEKRRNKCPSPSCKFRSARFHFNSFMLFDQKYRMNSCKFLYLLSLAATAKFRRISQFPSGLCCGCSSGSNITETSKNTDCLPPIICYSIFSAISWKYNLQ